MPNIKIDLLAPIHHGQPLTFRSPADCSQVTGLIIYYPEAGTTTSTLFQFADAHGNNVGNIDNLFAENVLVKVILDTTLNKAYVQNADTNAYLEATKATVPKPVNGSVITVNDSIVAPLHGLTLYGKTTQDGTPTPETPVEIKSAGGAYQRIKTYVSKGKNLFGGEALADILLEKAKATKDTAAGTVNFTSVNVAGKIAFNGFKPNTRYTIILYGRNTYSSGAKASNFRVSYTDGTYDNLDFSALGPDNDSYCVFVTDTNKTAKNLYGANRSGKTTLYYNLCGIFEGVLTEADFVPYEGQTLTISTPNGLNSIGEAKDEIDFARGIRVQNIGTTTFTGDTTVTHGKTTGDYQNFYLSSKMNANISIVCGLANIFEYRSSYEKEREGIYAYEVNGACLSIKVERLTAYGYDAEDNSKAIQALKGWLSDNPITILYALKSPVEMPLSAEELAQYAALHTYNSNTTVYNDAEAEISVKYFANNAAVPMSYDVRHSGKVLGIDEHGSVAPTEANDHIHSLADITDANLKADAIQHKSGTIIIADNGANTPVKDLKLYGKTTQNGTPAPDAQVPLEYTGKNGTFSVIMTGKNLLPSKMFNTTISGVTFNTNDDGTLTAVGTGTETKLVTSFPDVRLPAGTYTYSCGFSGQEYLNLQVYPVVNGKVGDQIVGQIGTYSSSKVFTLDKLTTVRVRILIYAGPVDCTIKPQLEMGNIETEYEPYKSQAITFSTVDGLPGIPVTRISGNHTDEKGQQWICDTIDFATGIYTKRVETKILTGAENWKQCSPETWYNYTYYLSIGNGSIAGYDRYENYCLCNQYVPVSRAGIQGVTTPDRCAVGANGNEITFTSNLATADEWKAELAQKYADGNPVIIQYVKKTPVEIPLSDEELEQYAALRTYTPCTTIYNDAGVYMDFFYYTPSTAVQMVHSPVDNGKILSIDEHGCVAKKKGLPSMVGIVASDVDITAGTDVDGSWEYYDVYK